MKPRFIADPGVVLAFLQEDEVHHAWAVEQFRSLPLPFLTCEAVLTETTYLLDREGLPRRYVLDLVAAGTLIVAFDPNREARYVAAMLERYASTPMDYADGCLVRMSELYPDATLLTLDADFHVYRRNRTEAVPVVMPS